VEITEARDAGANIDSRDWVLKSQTSRPWPLTLVVSQFGWSALHWATNGGHGPAAKMLIHQGADVNVADQTNETPLHWASANSNEELVRILRDAGADTNARNNVTTYPVPFL